MSGRVGDLSPKQKEALAKVSPHLGLAPLRAVASFPGGRGLGRGWVGGDRQSAADCGGTSSRCTELPAAPTSLRPVKGP